MVTLNWVSTSCMAALFVLMGSALPVKLRKPYLLSSALMGYGFGRKAALRLTPPAIMLEMAATAGLLLFPFPRLGGGLALATLTFYFAFVAVAVLRHRTGQSCGCYAFGHDRSVSKLLLVRNGAAVLLAIVPVVAGGVASGWLEWTLALAAAAVWITLQALLDELGTLRDVISL